MARFSYIAIDQQGRKHRGNAEAENTFVLANQLRQIGLTIISATQIEPQIKETKDSIGKAKKLFKAKIKSDELVIFYRQLATMVEAGVQLVDSLGVLIDQTTNQNFREILLDVREKIRAGSSFSEALRHYPDTFTNIVTSMIKVAEISGNLGKILNQIASYVEEKDKIDKKIKSATSYPKFIMIFFLIVLSAVVFGMVPKFKDIFESFGAKLPGPTMAILKASQFLKENILIELIIVVLLIVGFKYFKKHPKGKRLLHNLIFHIPFVGSLVQKSVVARFSQTLGTLVRNGVELVDALEIAAETTNNVIIQETIWEVKKAVTGGSSLAAALEQYPIFPPMMVKMIAVGEESGALEQMLEKIAEFNERQFNTAIDSLTSVIEPVLMICLGIVALIVVIALYLPIFQMSGAISGG